MCVFTPEVSSSLSPRSRELVSESPPVGSRAARERERREEETLVKTNNKFHTINRKHLIHLGPTVNCRGRASTQCLAVSRSSRSTYHFFKTQQWAINR